MVRVPKVVLGISTFYLVLQLIVMDEGHSDKAGVFPAQNRCPCVPIEPGRSLWWRAVLQYTHYAGNVPGDGSSVDPLTFA